MFGDGSDGDLTVTNGNYTYLVPDHKYQYRNVNIQSGGSLYCMDQVNYTGAVCYILCSGTFTLDGTIDLTYSVNAGSNGYTATVNGETFITPGVAAGGSGASRSGAPGGSSAFGWGGGGAGGAAYLGGQAVNSGGAGSTVTNSVAASNNGPTAGSTSNVGPTASNGYFTSGGAGGSNGGGGAGASFVWRSVVSGGVTLQAQGGAGGNNASNGKTILGTQGWSNASSNFLFAGAGGGGNGGYPGYAGMHLVIKAPTIILRGTINVSGGDGSQGALGGNSAADWASRYSSIYPAPPSYGLENGGPGGGGGGGNAGNIQIVYSSALTDTATKLYNGGAGGAAGAAGAANGQTGAAGLYTTKVAANGWMPFFI